MEAYKIRLFEEFGLLTDKITELEKFIHTEEFRYSKLKLRWLTLLQYSHMVHYLKCLKKRMDITLTMEDYEDYANYLEEQTKEVKEEQPKEVKKKSNKRKTIKKEKKNDQA